ncbi:unnamed protein product [Ilex paraguariensis]|uniref:Uncharacterized protein n=1 Tax=Ilex paraguariensis TaxID=185542 RepID=A0ABC8SME6_9AQUA
MQAYPGLNFVFDPPSDKEKEAPRVENEAKVLVSLVFELVPMGAEVPPSSAEVPASVGTGVSVPPIKVPSPTASSIPAIVSNLPDLPKLPGAPTTPSSAAISEVLDLPGPPKISTDFPPSVASELLELPGVILDLIAGSFFGEIDFTTTEINLAFENSNLKDQLSEMKREWNELKVENAWLRSTNAQHEEEVSERGGLGLLRMPFFFVLSGKTNE